MYHTLNKTIGCRFVLQGLVVFVRLITGAPQELRVGRKVCAGRLSHVKSFRYVLARAVYAFIK
jgi:hypothetical protein